MTWEWEHVESPHNFIAHSARHSRQRRISGDEFAVRSLRDQVLKRLDFVIARHFAMGGNVTASGQIEPAIAGR